MPEFESPLDSRLRSFFAEIKTQRVPNSLVGFRPAPVPSARRILNVAIAFAAVGAVAAGIAAFAFELNSQHGAGRVPTGQSAPMSNPNPMPPFRPSLPADEPGAKVLIPVTYGSGTRSLPTITLGPNEAIGYEYGCISSHPTDTPASVSVVGFPWSPSSSSIWSASLAGRCSNPKGASAGREISGPVQASGEPQTFRISLTVETDPSVDWAILVYEVPSRGIHLGPIPTSASTGTPDMAEGIAPPGATVLLPVTYGSGPARLRTFTWAPNDMLYVAYGCGSGVAGDVVTFAGDNSTFDGDFATGQCSGPDKLESGSGTQGGAGGPVNLTVTAAPSLKWVIFIYEAPPGLLGPAP